MPIKHDKEQLLHKWINTGNEVQASTCKGMLLKVLYIFTSEFLKYNSKLSQI